MDQQRVASFLGIDWSKIQSLLQQLKPYAQQLIITILEHAAAANLANNNPNTQLFTADPEVINVCQTYGFNLNDFVEAFKALEPSIAKLILSIIKKEGGK